MKCSLTSQPEMSMIQLVSVKLLLVGTKQTIQNNQTNIMKIMITTDGDHLLLKNERYYKWWEDSKNNTWDSTKDNLGIANNIEDIIDLNMKTSKISISVNITKMQIKDRGMESIANKEEIDNKEIIITNALIDQKTQFLQDWEMR